MIDAYDPEKNGFEYVGDVEWSDEPYQFNLTRVWRQGNWFAWARDAGCSCPTPFEDLTKDEVTYGTFHYLAAELTSTDPTNGDALALLERLMREGA